VNVNPTENLGRIDTSVPNLARVYDFLLGGVHNFPADRQFAALAEKTVPHAADIARLNRSFLRRVVLLMVDKGIRQFLDIGSGIPTVGNVHEIAQRADPACRVVYVDKEPIAVEHSRILLRGNERAAVIHADLRAPDDLFDRPEIGQQLDLSQPIGLLTLLVWHFVSDAYDPARLMARYRAVLAPGSYLALTHITRDYASPGLNQAIDHASQGTPDEFFPRDRARVIDLFAGFELVAPGVVGCAAWRPEGPGDFSDEPGSNAAIYAGVGRVP
jgi:SAM-dependent methyltransferase